RDRPTGSRAGARDRRPALRHGQPRPTPRGRSGARAAIHDPPLPRPVPPHRAPPRRRRTDPQPGDARGAGRALGGGQGGAGLARGRTGGHDMTDATPSRQAALFLQLVLGLQQSAMMALGKLMNPITRKVETHLDMARDTIDTLAALESRTQGNLEPDEERVLR